MKDHLIKLLTAAGITIAADATDADIQQAAEALAAKVKPAAPGAPITLSADHLAILETLKDLPKTVTTLAAKIATIESKDAQDEIKLILNSAAAEGKVVPKEAYEGAAAMTAPQLKLLVASLPVTVPLDRRTPLHTPEHQQQLVMNSAEDAVRKQLGISEEDWKKTA